MLEFGNIFDANSGVLSSDMNTFVAVFDKLSTEMNSDNDYDAIPTSDKMNILANNVILYYTTHNLLYDMDDLFKSLEIAESVKPIFMKYYKSIIEANIDTILSDDMPCKITFTEFPIGEIELRIAICGYYEYISKVKSKASNETFELLDKVSKHNIENITKVMSELYLFMQSRRFNVGFEEQQEECTRLCKEYNVSDIYKPFQIVINLFDVFPFNYNKFAKMIKYKVNDPDIDDIEIQRRYLISTLKKDSKYDVMKRQINSICDDYATTMARIEKNIEEEEVKIRNLYSGNDNEIDDYIATLVKSQS